MTLFLILAPFATFATLMFVPVIFSMVHKRKPAAAGGGQPAHLEEVHV